MGFQQRGFAIETVEDCPVTRGSLGVMTFRRDQIAMIAGAVRDKIEWMVLLRGQRSADGYEVRVDRFTVPQQYRSTGEVELAHDITLPDDCVGVMHSHHHMGAFFSGTDVHELNPRFPSSIVVAISSGNLGFNYQACGKVILPCGAMGMVDFVLAVDGVEKFAAVPMRGQHDEVDLEKQELKGCSRLVYADHAKDPYLAILNTQCGLSVGEEVQRPMVFGMDGRDLLAAVVAQTVQPPVRQGGYTTGSYSGVQRTLGPVEDNNTKGSKKRGKGKRHRNGLQKLARPEPMVPKTGRGSIVDKCDDCGWWETLTYNSDSKEWWCDQCWDERTDDWLADNEQQSSDDRTVVVTTDIEGTGTEAVVHTGA